MHSIFDKFSTFIYNSIIYDLSSNMRVYDYKERVPYTCDIGKSIIYLIYDSYVNPMVYMRDINVRIAIKYKEMNVNICSISLSLMDDRELLLMGVGDVSYAATQKIINYMRKDIMILYAVHYF